MALLPDPCHRFGLAKGPTDPRTSNVTYPCGSPTHPGFARRGVGRLVLRRCEEAAAAEGFTALDLMATLCGLPLYLSAGFVAVEQVVEPGGGVPVPLIRMRKEVAPR